MNEKAAESVVSVVSTVVLFVALLASTRADAGPLPMVWEAVSAGSDSAVVVVPRPLPAAIADRGSPGDQVILRLFDSMKSRFPAAYGTASLSLSKGKPFTATLTLDPGKPESWDVVAAEVYYTLKSLGVGDIIAPLKSPAPLSPDSINILTAVTVLPWHAALSADLPGSLYVAVESGRMVSAASFRKSLESGDPEIVRLTAAACSSPDESLRLAALKGIALIRLSPSDQATLGALMPAALRDQSPTVRSAALDVISAGKLKVASEELSAVAARDTDPAIKLRAARMLSERGIHDYDHLLEMDNLRSNDARVVMAALKKLAASGRPDVAPAVSLAVQSENVEVRRAAVEILTSMKAVAVMAKTASRNSTPTDARTLLDDAILGICPLEQTSLMRRLSAGPAETAVRAMTSLCEDFERISSSTDSTVCGKPAGRIATLSAAADRTEQAVRERAIECLGRLSEREAADILLALADRQPNLRSAADAAAAVLSRQPQSVLAGIAATADGSRTLRLLALTGMASKLGTERIEPATSRIIGQLIRDPDPDIRKGALRTAAASKDQATASLAMEAFEDRDENIRISAVRAAAGLVESGTSRSKAEDVLRKALEDLSPSVRAAALESMATRPVPGTKARLKMLAGNARPEIRRPAVSAYLASLEPGEDAVRTAFVSGILYDPDETIRVVAVSAMEDLTDNQSVNAVGALVIDPSPAVRAAVARSLGRMRTETAMSYLRKAAADGEAGVRRVVAEAVARFDRETSIPVLKNMLDAETDSRTKETIRSLIGN